MLSLHTAIDVAPTKCELDEFFKKLSDHRYYRHVNIHAPTEGKRITHKCNYTSACITRETDGSAHASTEPRAVAPLLIFQILLRGR